jgi:8-oxo-dGTP diphosphatase
MNARVVVGAAIVRDGLLLAAQRAHPAELAGRWELPGGRVEPGELEPAALRRECAEELEVDVRIGDRVGTDVVLPSGALLKIYAATLNPGSEPRAVQHKQLRWLPAGELATVDWLPADRELLPALATLLQIRPPDGR